ncbi:MAG: hypothetical protein ACKV2U_03570 [Bryobacteraceae bacterium]
MKIYCAALTKRRNMAVVAFASTGLFFIQNQLHAENPSPFTKGIAAVQNRATKQRQIAEQLRSERDASALAIRRIMYEVYGSDKDPVKVALELQSLIKTTVEGIEEGRSGRIWEPFGRASQLTFDLIISAMPKSPLKAQLQATNASQQVAFEVARATQSEMEARLFERMAAEDERLIQVLSARETQWIAKNKKKKVTKKRPPDDKTTTTKTPDDQTDDYKEFIELFDWADQGNRKLGAPADIERFYRRKENKDLRQFREVSEFRSPESELNQWKEKSQANLNDLTKRILEAKKAGPTGPETNNAQASKSKANKKENELARKRLEEERKSLQKQIDAAKARPNESTNCVEWCKGQGCGPVNSCAYECTINCDRAKNGDGGQLDSLIKRRDEIDLELKALALQ